MKKAGFWKTDWFLGVAVVVCIVLFDRTSDLIPSLERKAYDLGVIATSRAPLDKIAVIAIDEQSLANLGRWPWSREVLGKMTDSLSAAKAKIIAYTVLFSEPQTDAGYTYVTKLLDLTGAGTQAPAAPVETSVVPSSNVSAAAPASGELAQIRELLKEAEQALNTDRRLAESFARAGNVVPMTLFELGTALGKPDKPLPEYVTKNSLPKVGAGHESDMPKVTDFGIARITDSSKTKTGMVLGTPSYMSPEQLSGKKVDGRSDLFSLAVTLYLMLCGALPFVGDSMAQLMFRIANEPATEIFLVRRGLPPPLVAFLDKAMAKEPGERYQTGEEFAAALRAAFAAAGAAASPVR